MYICICNGITDSQIKEAVANGVGSFEDLQQQLGVANQCGECKCHARKCLRECNKSCNKQFIPGTADVAIAVADIRAS